ncbi:MAG: HD domain-containing phosphohydrolase [Pseudomonadota bacterium]
MTATARTANFSTANPHALATILEASETKRIIASTDIFDLSGIKLWARHQPVSQELQRKLMDRQLRQPIESCLKAEDGVSSYSLVKSLQTLLEQDTPLTQLLRKHADKLVREAVQLPLHSVAQLLLTAGQASRPESYAHAVQAMALNGALMIENRGGLHDVRLAMLCGLLHDLGEMYIDPLYTEANAERSLDFRSYQQLVVHPHIGNLLIAQLTDYPRVVSQAIAEHHERLDGTGYPHCLQRQQISSQGKLLAVTEATLHVLRGDQPCMARASVALRVVPGEFDLGWVGAISKSAHTQRAPSSTLSSEAIQARLGTIDHAMQEAQANAAVLSTRAESAALKDALGLTQHLLTRLRVGWNASGLWSREAVATQDEAEIEAIEEEFLVRLRSIERAAWLRAGTLQPADAQRLEVLCNSLINDLR